jgi:hypothetical protein
MNRMSILRVARSEHTLSFRLVCSGKHTAEIVQMRADVLFTPEIFAGIGVVLKFVDVVARKFCKYLHSARSNWRSRKQSR